MDMWAYLKGVRPSPDREGEPIGLVYPQGVEDLTRGPVDQTSVLAENMQMAHPYLMVDREVINRIGTAAMGDVARQDELCTLRDQLSDTCRQKWRKDTLGEGQETRALPTASRPGGDLCTPREMREELLRAQMKDPFSRKAIDQLTAELDPYLASKRKTGVPQPEKVITGVTRESFRLGPNDGVLEYRQLLATVVMWVPYIPEGPMELVEPAMKWRKWLF